MPPHLSDPQLTERIKQAIIKDERLSFQPIDVTVDQGVATLMGTVHSYRRKLAAIEITSSIDGCRDVIDRLTVHPEAIFPDDEVTQNVSALLDAHADVTKEAIVVSVETGVVTLSGHVGSQWERAIAEDVARSARGVRDVTNLLIVDVGQEVHDKHLCEEIMATMGLTRGLAHSDVHVAASSGTVVFSGTVGSLFEKQMAESVARRFRPLHVQNEISVSDGRP